MCSVDLGLLVVTDQEYGNLPHPLEADEATLVLIRKPQAIYTDNWT
jgi:hypothetical protein